MAEELKKIKTNTGYYYVKEEYNDHYIVYTGHCDEQGCDYLKRVEKTDVKL